MTVKFVTEVKKYEVIKQNALWSAYWSSRDVVHCRPYILYFIWN